MVIIKKRPLAVCRRAAFRDVKYQFAPLRAQRTRSFNGFLSDLSVLRGKKLTPIEFSDSLLDRKYNQATVSRLNGLAPYFYPKGRFP
jgi:hypothetical protein